MTQIIKWTPKVRIWYWDVGNTENFVVTDADKREQIENLLNSGKIVNIEGISISKNRFLKAEALDYVRDNVQQFILLQAPHVREVLKLREAEKKEKVNRGFDSVDEALKYLNSRGYEKEIRRI